MFKRVAIGLGVGLVAVAIGLFLGALGKEYPHDLRAEWCSHARALQEARMLDRAYTAFRRLEQADGACDAEEALADLRFDLTRRAELLEGARAFRRAADLRGRLDQRQGRREALQRAFAAYQDALALDPFARGGRRAFARLVATYRRIDPLAPDCARARDVAGAGLLPEGRLYLSRALRRGEGDVCRAGLVLLGAERAAAYREMRDGQAREAVGDRRGARGAYARALSHDSSERLALDGLARVEPRPLRKEGDWADDLAGFFGKVTGVVPTAMWAFLAMLALGVLGFAALWFGARAAANAWPRRVGWLVEHTPGLRRTLETRVQTEGTADLEAPVAGIIDDTLARLHTPWIDPQTGKVRTSVATPRGTQAEIEGLFTAVEPMALAAQVLRRVPSWLRTTSDVALVLERATGEGELEQRWRVIDRHTRRTLARMNFHQQDLPFVPDAFDKRVEFFIIRAAEELRATILEAEAIRSTSLAPEVTR